MAEPGDMLRALRWLTDRGYAWDTERELYVRPADELGLTIEDAVELSLPSSNAPRSGTERCE
jgi:hypothetical protein